MLDQIPTEVLSQIAYHLSLPTLSPSVPLLQTCSALRDALTPSANPRLYARLYRAAFDVKAAKRRGEAGAGTASDPGLGLGAAAAGTVGVDKAKGKSKVAGRGKGNGKDKAKDNDVTQARGLTKELEQRVRAIKRVEGMVRQNDVRGMGVGEAWVLYLMLVENGKHMPTLCLYVQRTIEDRGCGSLMRLRGALGSFFGVTTA